MRHVQTDADFREVAGELAGTPLLAADTEAAGYHRYFDRVCLLQLSTRSHTYVVDTLALTDLEPIRPLFESADTEVVFHDADYDLRLLHRDFDLTVGRLFDTKVAAQFLGEPAFGLASLVEKFLGIKLEKAYQRADWARRPLPQAMLEYAAEDTRYLPDLRDRLREALVEKGRLEWAEEDFHLAEAVRWTASPDDPDAFMRMKNTRDLKPRQLAALRELHGWREAIARERDVAPFRVLGNDALIELARRMPNSRRGLGEVPNTPRNLGERYGTELLEALERARRLPQSELPVRKRGPRRPPPDPEFDATLDRLRTARDRAAEALELDRGFLMPRSQLEELARRRPASEAALLEVPGVRRWQVEALGAAVLEAIRS